jgi:hypothetical protein
VSELIKRKLERNIHTKKGINTVMKRKKEEEERKELK